MKKKVMLVLVGVFAAFSAGAAQKDYLEEVESLGKDLQEIVKYISQLDKLDVSDVEPTYQVFEMENVWRDDEILKQDASREELLSLTKKARDNQVEVPKVL